MATNTLELNKTIANRKALAKYYRATQNIVSKKEGAVPVLQWWGTFAIYNHMVGSAVKYALKMYPEGVEKPPFLGAILRFVINHSVLKEIRNYLAKNPGVENPDEVVDLIIKKIDELLSDERRLTRLLRDKLFKLGIPESEIPKYLEALKIVLPKMKDYIDTEGRKIVKEALQG